MGRTKLVVNNWENVKICGIDANEYGLISDYIKLLCKQI